jgi:hypothetical protein
VDKADYSIARSADGICRISVHFKSPYRIELVDVSGALVKRIAGTQPATFALENSSAAGMYLVRILHKTDTYTEHLYMR